MIFKKAEKKLQLETKQKSLLKVYKLRSGPSSISSTSQANKYYFYPFYPLHSIITKLSFMESFPGLKFLGLLLDGVLSSGRKLFSV